MATTRVLTKDGAQQVAKRQVYLDSACVGRMPGYVREAMAAHSGATMPDADEHRRVLSGLRASTLSHLNADGYVLKPTTGALSALRLALFEFFELRKKTVITTYTEYGPALETFRRKGARILQVSAERLDFNDNMLLFDIRKNIKEQKPHVIFLSHLTRLGDALPLAKICAIARRNGIPTIVDGAHAMGRMRVDLASIRPDMYLVSYHKALGGPQGTGALLVAKDFSGGLPPSFVSDDETYSTGQLAGAAAAVEHTEEVRKSIGKLEKRLLRIPSTSHTPTIQVYTPKDPVGAGIFTFAVDLDIPDADIMSRRYHKLERAASDRMNRELRRRGIVLDYNSDGRRLFRFSFDHSNTEEDVQALLDALSEIRRQRAFSKHRLR